MKRYATVTYSILLSVLDTYSTVVFAKGKVVGLLILIATFSSPLIGFSGLMGTITALLFVRMFSLEAVESKSGLTAFNSLLVSLGLGYFHSNQAISLAAYIPVLVFISVTAVLFYVSTNHISMTYLKLPSMSLAFSFVIIFFILFSYALGRELTYVAPSPLFELPARYLSGFWQGYFQSLGSIFFLPFTLTGIIIALALFINSRIAGLLSLLGFTTIWIFYQSLMPTGYILFPGLNAILIAITVGGVFLVPGKTSYLLAIFSVIIGGIFLSAMHLLLAPYGIAPYTFPYVLTVFIILYPLTLRLKNDRPYFSDLGTYHPEENLAAYYSAGKRFCQTTAPQFYLPVIGEWRITQGNDGEVTHRQQWSHAWDFEIYDNNDKPFNGNRHLAETKPKNEDYYAFGKPVLASADGYIAKVVDGIDDNPIGQLNTKENWGNVVTIYHSSGVHTLYGHLKKGSIRVKLGEYVTKGDRIGSVGNSGRSAVPHLHFNVQLGAEPGAQTIKSFIANYKQKREDRNDYLFLPYGIPSENESVSSLIPSLQLQDMLHLKVKDKNSFKVKMGTGSQTFTEDWKIETNLYGQLHIKSDRGSCLEFSFYDGIYNLLSFRGSKKSALFAFAAIVSRLPYQENIALTWQDDAPLSVFLPCCTDNLVLLLHTLFRFIRIENRSNIDETGELLTVNTTTVRKLFSRRSEPFKGQVTFRKMSGIEKIELFKNGTLYLYAENES